MVSEEEPDLIPIPEQFKCGKYVLLFDPLDGSSNIDVNVPVGTIFSVLRRVSPGPGRGTMPDLLQPGSHQVASGYVIYGSSTMLTLPMLLRSHSTSRKSVFVTFSETSASLYFVSGSLGNV